MSFDLISQFVTERDAYIEDTWYRLCSNYLDLDEKSSSLIWHQIALRYQEKHRHYHHLQHIYDLLKLAERYHDQLKNKLAVYLAIFFHDIVYEPHSSTNEEDSAKLFKDLLPPHAFGKSSHELHHLANDCCANETDGVKHDIVRGFEDRDEEIWGQGCEYGRIRYSSPERNQALVADADVPVRDKVYSYILETKLHNVSSSRDRDLQLFVDFDMQVLGRPRAEYRTYAMNIRREYAHIQSQDYCTGRAAALKNFLQAVDDRAPNEDQHGVSVGSSKFIFATPEFRSSFEDQARSNIEWECAILSTGSLVQ